MNKVIRRVDARGISGPWVAIEITSTKYGDERVFKFDISLFFGIKHSMKKAALMEKFCQRMSDEEVLRVVDEITASQMTKTLSYL